MDKNLSLKIIQDTCHAVINVTVYNICTKKYLRCCTSKINKNIPNNLCLNKISLVAVTKFCLLHKAL